MTDHQHTADVLNRAADLIERDGWSTGTGWNLDYTAAGPYCAEGAINAVNQCSEPAARRALRHYLTGSGAEGTVSSYDGLVIAFSWNDRQTEAIAVISALRAAAAIEQACADEHTATDTGYDTAAEMLAVAGDAADRTLAAIR